MKAHTITVHFTNDYGKRIEAKIIRDNYGELTVKYLSINDKVYNAKNIRTEWRETIIINYIREFVDIEEYFADSIEEEVCNRHCVDNF